MIKIIDDDVEIGGVVVGEIDMPIQAGEFRLRINPMAYALHISADDLVEIADELDDRNDRWGG